MTTPCVREALEKEKKEQLKLQSFENKKLQMEQEAQRKEQRLEIEKLQRENQAKLQVIHDINGYRIAINFIV